MNKLNTLLSLAILFFILIETSATGGSHQKTLKTQKQPSDSSRFRKLETREFLKFNIEQLKKYTQLVSYNFKKQEMKNKVFEYIKLVETIMANVEKLANRFSLQKNHRVVKAIKNATKVLQEAKNYHVKILKNPPFPKFPALPKFPVQQGASKI